MEELLKKIMNELEQNIERMETIHLESQRILKEANENQDRFTVEQLANRMSLARDNKRCLDLLKAELNYFKSRYQG